MSMLHNVFNKLPKVFPATQLDELTNNIFRWRTIKNLRCKRKIPESCFAKVSPRKILIDRDEFLAWAEAYAANTYKAY